MLQCTSKATIFGRQLVLLPEDWTSVYIEIQQWKSKKGGHAYDGL